MTGIEIGYTLTLVGFLFTLAALLGLRSAITSLRAALDREVNCRQDALAQLRDRVWDHQRDFTALCAHFGVGVVVAPQKRVVVQVGGGWTGGAPGGVGGGA